MSESSKKGLNTTQIILIIGILLIICAIGVGAYFIIRNQNKQVAEPLPSGQTQTGNTTGNLIVDESNLASIGEEMQAKVEDGMFEVNMNTVWNFKNGESASDDAYVANASSNHYPITFEVILDETEVIYSSTLIPIGNRIKEIKLDKDLDAGAYDAVCMYHLWREDGTENSKVGVNVIINVLE